MGPDTGFIYQYLNSRGQSGLELDVLCRHYSRITPAYGCRLVNAVLSALEDASAHAPVEIDATVKIQATFRMYQQRKAFLTLRSSACLIQRVYRSYATRKHLDVERAAVRQMAYLQAVFDMFATRIQACYRGYQSRKTKSNYYAQQAYLKVVTARSSEVLAQALSTQVEQDTLRKAEAKRQDELSYARRTAHMHYMVSTCSVPSIYQRSVEPPPGKQSVHNTLHTSRGVCGHSGESGLVSPGLPTVKLAKERSDSSAAEDETLMAQVAAYVSGQKLESDIRHHARAARLERIAVTAKRSPSPIAPTVLTVASLQSSDRTTAVRPRAEGTTVRTTLLAQGARLPALAASQPVQRSRQVKATALAASPTVPWEELSLTHPPQKPLTTPGLPLKSSFFSETGSPATLLRTTQASRKPRGGQQTAEGDSFQATGTAAAAAAAPAPSEASIEPSILGAAVSSFHRRFAVKRHDCLGCQLSITNGIVSDGAGSHALSGPLSPAREEAAVQRSVDQKVMQALHGDAVFKVSARRGLQ
ncbi:IQ calmodulinbinding motif containing protein [Leishmania braziliensis]|nr:IQ calmodulinbinding motif containing protein [Leishmania braziliensis]